MKDYAGIPLSIGDTVYTTMSNYKTFITGQITSFTPQQVNIETDSGSVRRYPEAIIRQVITADNYKLLRFSMGEGDENESN